MSRGLLAGAAALPDEDRGIDADDAKARCAKRIQYVQGMAVTPEVNLWVLPPHSQRALPFSMVDGKKDAIYVAVGTYRGHHRHIHDGIQLTFESKELGKFRYRGVGEFLLRNDHDYPTTGKVVGISETAYFFQNFVVPNELGDNDAEKVEERLRKNAEKLVGKSVAVTSFRRSVLTDSLYWMHGLDVFVHDLARLKELGLVQADQNYRAFVSERLATFAARLHRAVERHPERAVRIRLLAESLHQGLSREAVDYYLKVLRNDGIDTPELHRLLAQFQAFRLVGLTIDQWVLMDQDLRVLVDYMAARTSNEFLTSAVQILQIR